MKKLFYLVLMALSLNSFSMSKILKKVDPKIEKITAQKYEEIKIDSKPLFLSFNADWCPNCQKQNLVLSQVMVKYAEKANFYTVDWDKKEEYGGPTTEERTTIALVKNNQITNMLVGKTDENSIEEFIKKNIK